MGRAHAGADPASPPNGRLIHVATEFVEREKKQQQTNNHMLKRESLLCIRCSGGGTKLTYGKSAVSKTSSGDAVLCDSCCTRFQKLYFLP
jgi:hypothetical protein